MDNLQRRTDVVIAGYLLTTAALVAAFHEQFALWKALVAAHLLASAFIYCLRFLPPKLPGVVQFFRDWYPVMVLPLLYVATVYGRFHYALDVIAGLALAVALVGSYRVVTGREVEARATTPEATLTDSPLG